MKVELGVVKINKPQDLNIIIGQSHFIKTVEDIYEAIVGAVPNIKFALAFCEASAKRLIRVEGNDEQLKKIVIEGALQLGCGHIFLIVLKEGYPINVLNQIKNIPEVCRIFCATANPLEAIIVKTDLGNSLLGVVDGLPPVGVETPQDVKERKELLRKFGYKL
ncbi:MAG: adenosine-specific kinase [Candidatus Omnitrophota bacterium]|nr:MAG: adenosine-specific kinase [Candidatus Omnitrophota bacterium]